MSNITATTVRALAERFVAAEASADKGRTRQVSALHAAYAGATDSLRDLAAAINSRRATVAAEQGYAMGERRDMTHTTLALYVNTGALIERFGRGVNDATVSAAFRYISRNPGKGVIAELVDSMRAVVDSDESFAAVMSEAYAELASRKAASKKGAAAEAKGGESKTLGTDSDTDSESPIEPVMSAEVIVTTLQRAATRSWSEAEAAKIKEAMDALFDSLEAAPVAVTA